jgi:hypothetical protein
MELAIGKYRRWWIYCNTFKRLILSFTDCRKKGDLDRKSSAADFEGIGSV